MFVATSRNEHERTTVTNSAPGKGQWAVTWQRWAVDQACVDPYRRGFRFHRLVVPTAPHDASACPFASFAVCSRASPSALAWVLRGGTVGSWRNSGRSVGEQTEPHERPPCGTGLFAEFWPTLGVVEKGMKRGQCRCLGV